MNGHTRSILPSGVVLCVCAGAACSLILDRGCVVGDTYFASVGQARVIISAWDNHRRRREGGEQRREEGGGAGEERERGNSVLAG